MNFLTKTILAVSFLLFVSAFMPLRSSQAAVFEGSQTPTGSMYGLCIGLDPNNPGPSFPDDCTEINCYEPAYFNNPLCIPETAVGTGIARESLGESGITHTDNFGDYIKKLVNFALPYLVLAAFVGYVIAGFMYVTAFGNDEQMQKAKKILIWVSIGLILVMLSYAITNLLTGELVEGLRGEDEAAGN